MAHEDAMRSFEISARLGMQRATPADLESPEVRDALILAMRRSLVELLQPGMTGNVFFPLLAQVISEILLNYYKPPHQKLTLETFLSMVLTISLARIAP